MNLLARIFDSSDWLPRLHCGIWTPPLLWGTIVSDLAIWLSYMLIPIIMIVVIRKRGTSLPFPRLWGMYVAFILLCGQTHLVQVVMFWHPAYRLALLISVLTALVSLATTVLICKYLPLVLQMKTPGQVASDIFEARMVIVREQLTQISIGVEGLISRNLIAEENRTQALNLLQQKATDDRP